jgi:hypothetical protein
MAREIISSNQAISLKELSVNPEFLIVSHSGIVELQVIPDKPGGVLRIGTTEENHPFEIKRYYFIDELNTGEAVRGKHAHRKHRQVIFAARGRFTLALDDGFNKQKIEMDSPQFGIILDGMIWHEMTSFSKDCLIAVFADHKYDEADYVRDYYEFTKLV